jgi:hypothetical protein
LDSLLLFHTVFGPVIGDELNDLIWGVTEAMAVGELVP